MPCSGDDLAPRAKAFPTSRRTPATSHRATRGMCLAFQNFCATPHGLHVAHQSRGCRAFFKVRELCALLRRGPRQLRHKVGSAPHRAHGVGQFAPKWSCTMCGMSPTSNPHHMVQADPHLLVAVECQVGARVGEQRGLDMRPLQRQWPRTPAHQYPSTCILARSCRARGVQTGNSRPRCRASVLPDPWIRQVTTFLSSGAGPSIAGRQFFAPHCISSLAPCRLNASSPGRSAPAPGRRTPRFCRCAQPPVPASPAPSCAGRRGCPPSPWPC